MGRRLGVLGRLQELLAGPDLPPARGLLLFLISQRLHLTIWLWASLGPYIVFHPPTDSLPVKFTIRYLLRCPLVIWPLHRGAWCGRGPWTAFHSLWILLPGSSVTRRWCWLYCLEAKCDSSGGSYRIPAGLGGTHLTWSEVGVLIYGQCLCLLLPLKFPWVYGTMKMRNAGSC